MEKCNLCCDGTVTINSIFGLSMTSGYSTYDIGILEDIRFCPKCGRKMERLPVPWSTAFEDYSRIKAAKTSAKIKYKLSTEEGE